MNVWLWAFSAYVAGLLFLLGMFTGAGYALAWWEWAQAFVWPITVPAGWLLRWWQWGKVDRDGLHTRKASLRWWQRNGG